MKSMSERREENKTEKVDLFGGLPLELKFKSLGDIPYQKHFILNRRENCNFEQSETVREEYCNLESLKKKLKTLHSSFNGRKKNFGGISSTLPSEPVADPQQSEDTFEWVEYISHLDMVNIFFETIKRVNLDLAVEKRISFKKLAELANPEAFNYKIKETFFLEKSKKQKEIFLPICILDQFNLFENKGKKAKIEKKNLDANFIRDLASAEQILYKTNKLLFSFNDPFTFSPMEIMPFYNEDGMQTIHVHSNYKNFSEMSSKQKNYFMECYNRIKAKKKKKLSKIPVSIMVYLDRNEACLHISEQNGISWLDSPYGTPTV